MSVLGKRTIYVGPADGANHKPLNVEGVAVDAMLPGTILKQTAAGLATSDIAATVFSEQLMIADKDQQRTKSVDDAWVINENMVGMLPRSGELFNALVVTGQVIAERGTPLARNGAGLLKIAVTPAVVGATSEQVVAYADEIITTAATTLVRVRIA